MTRVGYYGLAFGGLGFKVSGFRGSGVKGLRFRVWVFGLGIRGFGLRVGKPFRNPKEAMKTPSMRACIQNPIYPDTGEM